MEVLYRIKLRRQNRNLAWGFKLKGGLETGEPLTFREIYPNSIADNCGIREGDQFIALEQHLTQNMSNSDVQEAIMNAGNVLEIILERPRTNKIENRMTEYPPFQSNKTMSEGAIEKTQHEMTFDKELQWRQPSDTDENNTISGELFNCFPSHWTRRYSSPPPKWKSYSSNAGSSFSHERNLPNTEEYLDLGSSPLMRVKHQNELDEYKTPCGFDNDNLIGLSLRSQWTPYRGDFNEKSRKVHFAEPPESNVIELESISSFAPSEDFDFNENISPFHSNYSMQNSLSSRFNQDFDDEHANLVDSLVEDIDRIDINNYFPEFSLRGLDLRHNKPSSELWNTDPFISSKHHDILPQITKSRTNVTSERLNPNENKSKEERSRFIDHLFTNQLDQNSPFTRRQFSRQSFHEYLPINNDLMAEKESLSCQSDRNQIQPTTFGNNSAITTSDYIKHPFSSSTSDIYGSTSQDNQMFANLDAAKTGLFAVLDRSVTDKIMSWNRPANLGQSATYKLLKELEHFDKDDK